MHPLDGTLILWDLDTGDIVRQLAGHTDSVTGVDISSDGTHALSSSWDGTIIHWDLQSGKAVQRFVGHQDTGVEGVTYGADDLQAISYGWDGSLIMWDVASGQLLIDLMHYGLSALGFDLGFLGWEAALQLPIPFLLGGEEQV